MTTNGKRPVKLELKNKSIRNETLKSILSVLFGKMGGGCSKKSIFN